jgi:LysM repeat protein
LVTATNLQAQEGPVRIEDVGNHSILSKVTHQEMEDLVVEEGVPMEFSNEMSYLSSHAVLARAGFVASQGESDPSADILFEDSESSSMPIVNAIRVQTEIKGESQTRTRTKIVEHVVQEGENVGTISRKYGLQVVTILSANNLSARSIIRPGQKLKILPTDGIVYTVKRGDTLVSIASKYKSDAEKILEFNNMRDAGHLSIGQDLILPGGKVPPPPAPKRTTITSNLRQVFTPADDSGTTRLLWPTAARRITQYYNYSHRGADIAGPVGTPIYAADDGVVTFSGWNSGGYGYMIIVDHGNGLYTRYAHGSRNLSKKGDVVKRGDVIQLMGSTGRSTGPHIHFEVMTGSYTHRVNPFDYIR